MGVMQKHGYIGEFEIIDDHRSQKVVVELNGRLNKCGVISPRFDFSNKATEKWIASLLPSRQFGHMVLTTSQGIMDHDEARRKQMRKDPWLLLLSTVKVNVGTFGLIKTVWGKK